MTSRSAIPVPSRPDSHKRLIRKLIAPGRPGRAPASAVSADTGADTNPDTAEVPLSPPGPHTEDVDDRALAGE